ncbi:type II toxin-antitoxin system VapC family toxin [Candidatus Woesearchaeota archaeon]|nr:type II toxin-antitoxin system VapC family toxin [Candidatus Woesearchaeota archaeon]
MRTKTKGYSKLSIIHLLHEDTKTLAKLKQIDAQFCTTAITCFEIWHGRKPTEIVPQLLDTPPVHVFDAESAKIAGDVLRSLKHAPLNLRDLLIGAICIAHRLELFTHNNKHFERLKEFGLVLAQQF